MHATNAVKSRPGFLGFVALCLFACLSACGGGGGGDDGGGGVPPPIAPVFTQQPTGVSVVEGTSATFSVAFQDPAGVSLQWLRNGVPVPGATQSSYTLASSVAADSGSRWSARAGNAGGIVTSAEAVLTVTVPPPPTPTPTLSISILAASITTAVTASPAIRASGAGEIYFTHADASGLVVKKLRKDGVIVPVWPAGTPAFQGCSPTTQAPCQTNITSTLDRQGNLYLAVASLTGTTSGINTFGVDGGYIARISADGVTTRLANWPVGSLSVQGPIGIAVSGAGVVYYVDILTGNLMRLSPGGTPSIETAKFTQPTQRVLAIGPTNLWLAVGNDQSTVYGSYAGSLIRKTPGEMPATIAQGAFGDVSVDLAGNVYLVNGASISTLAPNFALVPIAGQVDSLAAGSLQPGLTPGSLGRNVAAIDAGVDGALYALSFDARAIDGPGAGSLVRVRDDAQIGQLTLTNGTPPSLGSPPFDGVFQTTLLLGTQVGTATWTPDGPVECAFTFMSERTPGHVWYEPNTHVVKRIMLVMNTAAFGRGVGAPAVLDFERLVLTIPKARFNSSEIQPQTVDVEGTAPIPRVRAAGC